MTFHVGYLLLAFLFGVAFGAVSMRYFDSDVDYVSDSEAIKLLAAANHSLQRRVALLTATNQRIRNGSNNATHVTDATQPADGDTRR